MSNCVYDVLVCRQSFRVAPAPWLCYCILYRMSCVCETGMPNVVDRVIRWWPSYVNKSVKVRDRYNGS